MQPLLISGAFFAHFSFIILSGEHPVWRLGDRFDVDYIFLLDSEKSIPLPKADFLSQRIDCAQAGQYLKLNRSWFWYFTGNEADKRRCLEEIATIAGVNQVPGHRLEERAIQHSKSLAHTGPNTFLVIHGHDNVELLTPKTKGTAV